MLFTQSHADSPASTIWHARGGMRASFGALLNMASSDATKDVVLQSAFTCAMAKWSVRATSLPGIAR